jgi:16S rRNA (guanine527-N7)-methyltransferase
MAPQTEYGNLAGSGDRRDPIGIAGRRGKTERPVVRETSRRREWGQRNGSGTFGHGRSSERSPLPRRVSPEREPLPEDPAALPALGADFWTTLDEGLAGLGVELGSAERAGIDAHVRLLLAWNAAINLTALRTHRQVAVGHVLDALAALKVLRELSHMQPTSLLDMGSGGGFPGIPLALALPATRAALVDSVGKKARFLSVAAAAVARASAAAGGQPVHLEALAERAEDLAEEPDQRETWDMVVARAVGPVSEIAELGLPLVRRGGHVVAWKLDRGDGALEVEVQSAMHIARAAGGTPPRVVNLPGVDQVGLAGHCLVTLRKRGSTPARYPRPASERRRALLP